METRWLPVHPSVQFSSATQSRPPLWDPMDCSTPDLSVHCQLPGFTQTHVHWVSDAIQPPHPLSSSSPPALNLAQHQGLFQWVTQFFASGGQSIGASASVFPMNVHDWFPLGLTGLISLLSKGLSRVFSTIISCSTFFTVQLSHPYMTTGKTMALTIQTFVSKVMSLLFNMLFRFVITFHPRRIF